MRDLYQRYGGRIKICLACECGLAFSALKMVTTAGSIKANFQLIKRKQVTISKMAGSPKKATKKKATKAKADKPKKPLSGYMKFVKGK